MLEASQVCLLLCGMRAAPRRARPQQLAEAIWVVAEEDLSGNASCGSAQGATGGNYAARDSFLYQNTARRSRLLASRSSALLDPRSVRLSCVMILTK